MDLTGNEGESTPSSTPEVESTVNASPEPSTPEQKIEKSVKSEILRQGRVREVQITSNENGKYSVKVILNADSNLTANLTKQSILKDVGSAFYGLYKDDLGVEYAMVTTYYPTVDDYGNKSESIIYQARLIQAEASKVNWSEDKTVIQNQILPDIWEVEADKLNQL